MAAVQQGWSKRTYAYATRLGTRSDNTVASLRSTLMRTALSLTRNPADAEDIVQAAFTRVLERATHNEPDLSWQPWLRTVVQRLAIDLARRNKRRRAFDLREQTELEAPTPEPLSRWRNVDEEQLAAAMAACRSRCGDAYETYRLFHFDRLSYADIATRTGIPIGTVATRVHRARATIRSYLERSLDSGADASRESRAVRRVAEPSITVRKFRNTF